MNNFWDDFDPTAELFLTYPENFVALRIACLRSSISYFSVPCSVHRRLAFHSFLPINLCKVFNLSSKSFWSIPDCRAIVASINSLSVNTPGASIIHLYSVLGSTEKKSFNFRYSMKLNLRKLVRTCQNVLVAVSGRLLLELQPKVRKFLSCPPNTDFSRMVTMES